MMPEKTAVTVMDQHDDRRVRAREMRRPAIRVGTGPHMPGVPGFRRRSTDTAEAMACVPVDHGPRMSEQRCFLMRQMPADFPQIGNLCTNTCRRIIPRTDIDSKVSRLVEHSEKDIAGVPVEQIPVRQVLQKQCLRLIQPHHHAHISPDRNDTRRAGEQAIQFRVICPELGSTIIDNL